MSPPTKEAHWLDLYGSDCYRWQSIEQHGRLTFYRPLGLVEVCFDADGRYYEGRADINGKVDLEIVSKLDKHARQEHIALAWACLRARHILTSAKAPTWQSWMNKPREIAHKHCFQVDVPSDINNAIEEARKTIVFVEDHYDSVDSVTYYRQSLNATRRLDPEKALAHLAVLPIQDSDAGTILSCVFTAAHQIGDGLSLSHWFPDFTRLLNLPTEELRAELQSSIAPQRLSKALPPAQEALYPSINGNAARRRWFWVLTRILRHVRRPLPAGFPNPLLRSVVLPHHTDVPKLWNKTLQYERAPPNLNAPCSTVMSPTATERMIKICKDAKVTVGAGCFALAAILMMEFYEQREPEVPLEHRKPFITGFPLNPRPFLVGNPPPDSLMLAFSDGILLPFLPSSLDLEGRIRLLAKAAQRQLAIYQKRSSVRSDNTGLQYMSSRGAGRILQIQYLSSFERCEAMMPEEVREGVNPQGAYPMRPNMTRQTCGVSSVGRRPPLNAGVEHKNTDFVATALDSLFTVRARDGEFLIGIAGTDAGIAAGISVDGTSMDPDRVDAWLARLTHILEKKVMAEL